MKAKPKKTKKVESPEVVLGGAPVDPHNKLQYVISVTIEQTTYEGTGETALEALRNIPMPELIQTGNLIITHGALRKEMLYPTMQLRRLFNIYHQEVLIHDLVFGMS